MRILNVYVTKEILSILATALLILTFGMLGGNLLQALNYLSNGVPLTDFLKFMFYLLPMIFSYTIPWAILVSVLLLFGRMSANNEITAMRACGVSIFQIISPLILLTFVLTLFCLYLQTYLYPYYYGEALTLIKNVATTNPQALLSPGKSTDFGNMVVYIKNKKGDKITNIQIFVFDNNKRSVEQDITAANGKLKTDEDKQGMNIILYNYNIIDHKENRRIYGKELEVNINVNRGMNARPLVKQADYLTFSELLGSISLYHKLGLSTSEFEVQLSLRLAMSLAPIAFLLLGLPLAIRTSRKETSVGLFISVILAGAYFFFIIGCKSMYTHPGLRPEILLWLPNVLYQIGGLFFLYKVTGR